MYAVPIRRETNAGPLFRHWLLCAKCRPSYLGGGGGFRKEFKAYWTLQAYLDDRRRVEGNQKRGARFGWGAGWPDDLLAVSTFEF